MDPLHHLLRLPPDLAASPPVRPGEGWGGVGGAVPCLPQLRPADHSHHTPGPGQVSPQLRLVSGDYFQNKELQQVLKRIIRKPELENCELGILPIGEQPGKNEVQQDNNELWAVLRLQVGGPSQGRSPSLKVTFPGDQVGEEQQDGSEGGGDQTLGRHLLLPGSRVCRYWGLERD